MEKKKEFIINVLYFALILGLIYVAVHYVLGVVFPFIMGFIFSYIAIRTCKRLFKSDRKLHRVLTLLAIYLIIILLIWLLIDLGVSKIGDFIASLPGFYKNTMEPYISSLESKLKYLGHSLPPGIYNSLSDMTGDFFEIVKSGLSSTASGLVNFTTSFITGAPNMLASVILMITASFYLLVDYEKISEWFTSSLSDKALKVFNEIKDYSENTLFKILSAYAVIMFITFVELFIGLALFKVSNSGMWSFLIAFLDILPILGVGTVLIPWGVSSLITGNVVLGIELLVLYLIISFIRNIIEPKFVGTNLGLHPLATLFAMIVGLKFLGAVGMFGLPLTISFFKTREEKAKS